MSKLGRSWRAFRTLSRAERRILARAIILLPLTAAGLRVLGFQRVKGLLLSSLPTDPIRSDLAAARSVARIVIGAALWSPLPAHCLPRALVLCCLLTRQGLRAELRIGAGRPGGDFTAHAWVEHDGVPLAEPQATGPRFAAFDGALFRWRA